MESLQPLEEEKKIGWDVYKYVLYTHLHIKKLHFTE